MWFSSWLRRACPGTTQLPAFGPNRSGDSRGRVRNNSFRPRLERLEQRELLTAGFLDQGFGFHGKVVSQQEMLVNDVAVQPDGKIVVVGAAPATPGNFSSTVMGLMRFNSDGTPDTNFGFNGEQLALAADAGNSLVIQPDGKILVAGESFPIHGEKEFLVARFTSAGVLDLTFGGGTGYAMAAFSDIGGVGSSFAKGVALQPDGKIVAVGGFDQMSSLNNYFAVARFNPDGSLDQTFGTTEVVGGVTVGSGEMLTSFSTGGVIDNAGADGVVIQSDGRIVVGGNALVRTVSGPSLSQFALARYYSDGTLDSDFNAGGTLITPSTQYETLTGWAVQADGEILAVGNVASGGYALVRRYNPDGSPDGQFGYSGTVELATTTNGMEHIYLDKVAVQSDGRIIVAGSTDGGVGTNRFLLARFNPDGILDPSFSYDGLVETQFTGGSDVARGLAITPGGKIVAAGSSAIGGSEIAPGYTLSLARYNGDAGQFQFASDSGALQGASSVALTIVRTGGSSGAATVEYFTNDGTATAGTDYVTSGGTVYFADGQSGQTIYIPLHDDGATEGGFETFQVTLVAPTGGAVLAPTLTTATVTIKNFKVVTYPVNGTEGTALTGKLASFAPLDQSIPASDYQASITWSDGLSSPVTITANTSGGFDVASPHVPAEEGSLGFTVAITLGPTTITAQGTVNVADAPLTTQAVHLSVTLNRPFSGVVATFTDADPGAAVADYSATIDWKDGTTSAGTIGVSGNHFTVTGSHVFKKLPEYLFLHLITVTIVDHGPIFIVGDMVSDPPSTGRSPRHPNRLAALSHRNRPAATTIGGVVEADEPQAQR
jgi:uncharacterized delta-60 repeat protein